MRPTARFTLEPAHQLQALTPRVRTFAFVKDLTEITDLFTAHRIEKALSLVLAGLPAGEVLDVDADSDYGHAFTRFLDDYTSTSTRRTTLVVLGDDRDPHLDALGRNHPPRPAGHLAASRTPLLVAPRQL